MRFHNRFITLSGKPTKILFLFTAFLAFNTFIFAQTEEHYFRFEIHNISELDQITRIISIDKYDGKHVYGYANDQQWIDINNAGYEIERLPHPGSLYEHGMTNTLDGIQDWDTYPSYPLYKTMMRQYADSFSQICRLDTFGYSVNGKLMLAVKISDNVDADEDEPEFFYTSSMHGDETVGYVLMLRLIDYLLHQYGQGTAEGIRATHLVDNVEIWINPLANPDGTYRADTLSVNTAWRYNANAVDLNRDFPDRISDPVNTIVGREPETQAMMLLAAAHNFNLSANFHGGAQVVNYPWDNGAPSGNYSACPDDAWFIDISLQYASTNQDMLTGGFPNGITNGCDWYSIFGGRQDWIYYWHGGRETTIELWNNKNPPGSVLPLRWTNNKESFLSYMEQTYKGIRGIVSDDSTGEPIWAQIDIDGFAGVPVYSDPDVGDFHRMLLPGTYTVYVRAPYYKADTLYNMGVSDTGATRVNVALKKLAPNRIAGQVVLTDTNYFGGVVVETQEKSVLTNSSGYFEIESVYPGNLQIEFSKPGYLKTVVDTIFYAVEPLWVEVELAPTEYSVLLIDDDGGNRASLSAKKESRKKTDSAAERIYSRGQSANVIESALSDAGFEVIRESSSVTDTATWQEHDLLFWSSGAELSPTSSPAHQNGLIRYAQSSLPLIIEGGEIGYDFRIATYSTFRNAVLHYNSWVADNAGDLIVENTGHPITQGLPPTISLTYSGYGDQDAVTLSSGSQLILSNSGQANTAGLLINNQHLFYAFNLAAINEADARKLVSNSAAYFLPLSADSHDVALYKINGIDDGEMIQSGTQIPLSVTIRNYGVVTEAPGIPLEISIADDEDNVLFLSQTVTGNPILAGEEIEVLMGDWPVPDTTANLSILANVHLSEDQRRGNDAKSTQVTSLSAGVIFSDNFESALDSLSWKIVTAGSDSATDSWHVSYLPALGRYSMRVNPDSVNSKDQWLISPQLTDPSELAFYWDYGADQIQDTLLILASTTDDSLQSFTDTLLELNSVYPDTVNHFNFLTKVNISSPAKYISFVYRGDGGAYWAVDNIILSSPVTSITENPIDVPNRFALSPNYPNPFNPSTTIRYLLPHPAEITLAIFNILGEKVRILVDEAQEAGVHQVAWDGKNDSGEMVASGIYFYRMQAPRFTSTRKMLMVK